MQFQTPFNPAQYDPTQSLGQLPVGSKQLMVLTANDIRATTNDKGFMLVFTARVLEGPNAGATGAIRFNIQNVNPKAVEIAHRELSALAHCIIGPVAFDNGDKLHGVPFRADVGLQEPVTEKNYTEVKAFYDANGNPPKLGQYPNQQAPAAAATQPQSNGGNPIGAGTGFQTPPAAQQGWGAPAITQTPTTMPAAPAAPGWAAPATGQTPQGNPGVASATGAWSPQTGAVPGGWGAR